MNEAFRDWVTTVENTHYCIGSVGGPHPFPMMVRDFQRIIGVEARQQVLDQAGRLPDAVDRLRRRRLQRDRHLPRLHPRRRGAADRLRGGRRRRGTPERHAATLDRRLRGRAARHAHLRAAGRRGPDARHALDLGRAGLPGRRPRARLAEGHRPGRVPRRSPTPRRWTAFRLLCRTEGIIPAIESRARAGRRDASVGRELGPDALILVNLSGRGDKDVDTAVRLLRRVTADDAMSTRERPPSRRRNAEDRAALVGYLPAGFPDRRRRDQAALAHGRGRRRHHRGRPALLRPADGRPGHRATPCTSR